MDGFVWDFCFRWLCWLGVLFELDLLGVLFELDLLGVLFELGLLGELLGVLGLLGVLCELGVDGVGIDGMGGGGSVRWLQATKKKRVPKTKILKVINGLRFIVYSVSIGEYVLSKQVRAALKGMCGEFG
ncbi:MAG: hypothetical protein CM1200mP24_08450 [Gammaproteobacteria bacterium]|nr:MAG: hypothetical protein CM1200mP24_08450 [Gammaproteobacteria bacterium]